MDIIECTYDSDKDALCIYRALKEPEDTEMVTIHGASRLTRGQSLLLHLPHDYLDTVERWVAERDGDL